MCLTPINLRKETVKQQINDDYYSQQVPCGRCLQCRKLRVNSWFVRLTNELHSSDSAYFCTLTFDQTEIPFSSNGLMSLDSRVFQKFIKRLRKANKSEKYIKYFAVGEYGSQTYRPHYHVIMFNVSDPELINKAWGLGHVHVGKVQEASIFYTLKYALKGVFTGVKDLDDDRQPEKALMSKGLGLSFLTPAMIKHYKDDVSRPVTMLGNVKIGLPRYYRDKIFTDTEKRIRAKKLQKFIDVKYEKTISPLFPQRVKKMYSDKERQIAKTD